MKNHYLDLFESLEMDEVIYTSKVYVPNRPKQTENYFQKWLVICRTEERPDILSLVPFTSFNTFLPTYVTYMGFYEFVKSEPQKEEPGRDEEIFYDIPTSSRDVKYSLRLEMNKKYPR